MSNLSTYWYYLVQYLIYDRSALFTWTSDMNFRFLKKWNEKTQNSKHWCASSPVQRSVPSPHTRSPPSPLGGGDPWWGQLNWLPSETKPCPHLVTKQSQSQTCFEKLVVHLCQMLQNWFLLSVPSASACSSRGFCLNFMLPKCMMAPTIL